MHCSEKIQKGKRKREFFFPNLNWRAEFDCTCLPPSFFTFKLHKDLLILKILGPVSLLKIRVRSPFNVTYIYVMEMRGAGPKRTEFLLSTFVWIRLRVFLCLFILALIKCPSLLQQLKI